jgi:hypothetical protein
MVGAGTNVTLSSPARPLDFVVMMSGSDTCADAHSIKSNATSMRRTALNALNQFQVPISMSTLTSYRICFATMESLGDSWGQFVEISTGGLLAQPTKFLLTNIAINLKRVAYGSGDHAVTVTGLTSGDYVAFQRSNCGGLSINHNASVTRTALTLANAPSAIVNVHTTLLTGTYTLCRRASGSDVFVEILGNELMVIPLPTFTPNTVSISQAFDVNLGTPAATGDFVKLKSGSCTNANSQLSVVINTGTTGVHSQSGSVTCTNCITLTQSVFTAASTLHVCFATKESNGDSLSDFVSLGLLNSTSRCLRSNGQNCAGSLAPMRAVVGAGPYYARVASSGHLANHLGGAHGLGARDYLTFSRVDCSTISNSATAATADYVAPFQIAFLSHNYYPVSFHSGMGEGIFHLCVRSCLAYNPATSDCSNFAAKFEKRISDTFTVLPKPTFSPQGAVAGTASKITFHGQVKPGDIVVLQENDCTNAHQVSSSTTYPNKLRRELDKTLSITTSASMAQAMHLKVCFAARDALNDASGNTLQSSKHFAMLDTDFTQYVLKYDLKRVVESSGPHDLHFSGLTGGDRVYLSKSTCANLTDVASESSTHTAVTIATGTNTTVRVHRQLLAGTYTVCWKPNGSHAYRTVVGKNFTVVPKPTFTPVGTQAGSSVFVKFTNAKEGDIVVATSANVTNCSMAHTWTTNAQSLRTSLDALLFIKTSPLTTTVGTFRVCVATKESRGDASSDFAILPQIFTQTRVSVTDFPAIRRVVVGSGPYTLAITGLAQGDVVQYRKDTCSGSNVASSASTTSSDTKTMGQGICAVSNCFLSMQQDLVAGTYKLCHRSASATSYDAITNRDFVIIPLPTFSPPGATSGVASPITFTGDVAAGDSIVMTAETDCSNAHTIGTATTSLTKTNLDANNKVMTSAAMTAVAN